MTETTTRAAHTPGPWNVSKSSMDRLIYADSEHAFDLAIVRNGGSDANVEANARLIAAAPEMFAALKDSVNQLETSPYWIEQIMGKSSPAIAGILQTCRNARAVIAKAEGVDHA